MKKRLTNRGFTLIELLVVVGILALIGGFAIPRYIGVLGQAKTDMASGDVQMVQAAVDRYVLDHEGSDAHYVMYNALTTGTDLANPAALAALVDATYYALDVDSLAPKYLKKPVGYTYTYKLTKDFVVVK